MRRYTEVCSCDRLVVSTFRCSRDALSLGESVPARCLGPCRFDSSLIYRPLGTHVHEIVSDDAQSDPTLHSGEAVIETAT